MAHSMTGFSSSTLNCDDLVLSIDIRGVNSRFLDIIIRLPDELRALESRLREHISAHIQRGKVELKITLQTTQQSFNTTQIQTEAVQTLQALSQKIGAAFPHATPLSTADILKWPGILAEPVTDVAALQQHVLTCTQQTLQQFMETRQREGNSLTQLVTEKCELMVQILTLITPQIPEAVLQWQNKLQARLMEAIGHIDEDRVRQEMIFYATRIDVAEEIERLKTHLAETKNILKRTEPIGKRLDFMMQELHREANTLGAKNVSQAVNQASVELKLLIEQMREQIQNLE